MTEFFLKESSLNGVSVEIDHVRFDILKNANVNIKKLWDIEEAFTLFADAFVEIEDYFLKATLNYHYKFSRGRNVDDYFDDVRQAINLKLVSFLTASRVYEEQVYRRVSELSNLGTLEVAVKPLFSSAYDRSLEYRVMYTLRNQALHHQLPLGLVTFGQRNLSQSGSLASGGPTRLRVDLSPKLSVHDFISSDKGSAKTKKEVSDLDVKNLDLKFFIRGFIECVAEVHECIREQTQDIFDLSLSEIRMAYEKLYEVKEGEPKFICILRRTEEGQENHYIDFVQKNRLSQTRKLWDGLAHVQRSYISSEITKGNDTFPISHSEIWIEE